MKRRTSDLRTSRPESDVDAEEHDAGRERRVVRELPLRRERDTEHLEVVLSCWIDTDSDAERLNVRLGKPL